MHTLLVHEEKREYLLRSSAKSGLYSVLQITTSETGKASRSPGRGRCSLARTSGDWPPFDIPQTSAQDRVRSLARLELPEDPNRWRPLGGRCVLPRALRQGDASYPRIEARAAFAFSTTKSNPMRLCAPCPGIAGRWRGKMGALQRQTRPLPFQQNLCASPTERAQRWIERFAGPRMSLRCQGRWHPADLYIAPWNTYCFEREDLAGGLWWPGWAYSGMAGDQEAGWSPG